MLKPFLKAATVIIALSFISCTPQDNSIQADPISINVNDEITGTSTVTNVSDPIAVEGGNQEISIKGLESGKLYTIYSSKASAGSQSALSAVSGKSRISLNNISGGTYTFILPEGQSEITFTAVEIGLQNGGEFRIGDVATDEIEFQDGAKGMVIGQGKTTPIFTDNGVEHYETFYSIDVDSIPDPSRVVINETTSHGGNAKTSHYFSFVDENGKRIEGKENAILNLSGYETIYLYQSLIIDYSDMPQTSTLYFITPENIKTEGTTEISSPGTYIIEASNIDQYMIVEGLSNGLGAFIYDLNARYTDTGERFYAVFPIAKTKTGVVINIPKHDRDIMFDYDGETYSVYLTPADGSYPIETVKMGETKFTVNEGTYLFPLLPSGIPVNSTISLKTDNKDGQLIIGYHQPSGHGTASIKNGEEYYLGEKRNSVPEYLFFRNPSKEECTFTVTFR